MPKGTLAGWGRMSIDALSVGSPFGAIDHETVRKRAKITTNVRFKRLKPAALSRQILAKTDDLETGKMLLQVTLRMISFSSIRVPIR